MYNIINNTNVPTDLIVEWFEQVTDIECQLGEHNLGDNIEIDLSLCDPIIYVNYKVRIW